MFDNLVVSKKTPVGTKQLLTFPVSLAIHLAAVGLIVMASFWVVHGQPEPPINVVFVAPAAPPPPPPAAKKAPPKQETQAEKPKPKPINPDEMIAPTVVPPEPPKAENLPVESTGSADGIEGGIEGGISGGVPGGLPGGVPGGLPGEGAVEEEPIRDFTGVDKPVIIKKVEPIYPSVAREAGVEGVVIMEAVINKEGRVESVKVLRSVRFLDDAAIEAVKQWIFQPAKISGQPVKCYFVLTVNFKLNR